MSQQPLWQPDAKRLANANITAFIQQVNQEYALNLSGYDQLYAWSVANTDAFWDSLWRFADVVGERGERIVDRPNTAPNKESHWFPDAKINFAENVVRWVATRADEDAILFCGENESAVHLTWRELERQVSSIAAYLKACGIEKGDVVAGYLPNIAETVIAMLATSSLGAIWTSTSPDFGIDSVLDRFGQTQPKVLFTTDAYRYNGKSHDNLTKARAVRKGVPSIAHMVVIPTSVAPHRTAMKSAGKRLSPNLQGHSPSPGSALMTLCMCSIHQAPRASQSALSTAWAACCSTTSKSTSSTRMSKPETAFSISPPVVG